MFGFGHSLLYSSTSSYGCLCRTLGFGFGYITRVCIFRDSEPEPWWNRPFCRKPEPEKNGSLVEAEPKSRTNCLLEPEKDSFTAAGKKVNSLNLLLSVYNHSLHPWTRLKLESETTFLVKPEPLENFLSEPERDRNSKKITFTGAGVSLRLFEPELNSNSLRSLSQFGSNPILRPAPGFWYVYSSLGIRVF